MHLTDNPSSIYRNCFGFYNLQFQHNPTVITKIYSFNLVTIYKRISKSMLLVRLARDQHPHSISSPPKLLLTST